MFEELQARLATLEATTAQVARSSFLDDADGAVPIEVRFSDGTVLRAHYWRSVKDDRAGIASFDHGHRNGRPTPSEVVAELRANVDGRSVTGVTHDPTTGDILINLTDRFRLQILNVTGYEIWEVEFPDGYREFSNYAK